MLAAARPQWSDQDPEQPMHSSNTARSRRGRLIGLVAFGLAGALCLSACSIRKQFGVTTTVLAPKGNCDHSRIVEIGAALDLSGAQGQLGREYLAGIRMAIDQINQNQGVLK